MSNTQLRCNCGIWLNGSSCASCNGSIEKIRRLKTGYKRLYALCEEFDSYLNTHEDTSICSTSIFHKMLKTELKDHRPS